MTVQEAWAEFLDGSLFTVAVKRISIFRKVYAQGALAAVGRIREFASSGMAYKTVLDEVAEEARELRWPGAMPVAEEGKSNGERRFPQAGPIFGPKEEL